MEVCRKIRELFRTKRGVKKTEISKKNGGVEKHVGDSCGEWEGKGDTVGEKEPTEARRVRKRRSKKRKKRMEVRRKAR